MNVKFTENIVMLDIFTYFYVTPSIPLLFFKTPFLFAELVLKGCKYLYLPKDCKSCFYC